ncbi:MULTISPECIES: MarR family transcriptional regulator [unclassified Devosia]|uniref:MarR family winged helix-turn-helix transcriptional regulator n=1 Tax=unclassified Devosia TaxID=196773 RepID=UPI00145ED726|nr:MULTISPECIES: MarR family transcriptional regulator [unclassified Devosia]MBJ6986402.1 MarR family transcriptional regulator [Devosia sp. MC521]QMW64126.1 MarR family transcriptional regulator [Devosia sp. MC521]
MNEHEALTNTSDENLRTEATLGMIGYRLRRAQLSVFQQFLSFFETLNLRPAEYSVLVLMEENPGRKQSEIAAALSIKRANFVALVDGLEKRGLISREVVANDRRANALYLTEQGTRFLADARDVHAKLEDDLVARLGGTEQRDTLLSLLKKIT